MVSLLAVMVMDVTVVATGDALASLGSMVMEDFLYLEVVSVAILVLVFMEDSRTISSV